jgi:hypothetical protein
MEAPLLRPFAPLLLLYRANASTKQQSCENLAHLGDETSLGRGYDVPTSADA